MKGNSAGGLLVGASALQFGIVTVSGASLVRGGLNVGSMLAFRFAVAGLVTAAIISVRRRSLLPVKGERIPLALLGLAGYAVEASLFFAALNHGTATAVTLLFFTYPVIVTVASVALGSDPPSRLVGGALVTAVAGAAVVVAGGGRLAIRPLGILLALGSALMFAIYLIGVDRFMRKTDSAVASFWVSVWAALGLCATLPLQPGRLVPEDGGGLIALAALGVATAGAFACLMAGMRRIGPVRASIIAAVEPLSASTLAVVFLNERLSAFTVVGGVLILVASAAASITRKESKLEIP